MVTFSWSEESPMRNPLRRYYGRAHLHFITFGCYRRQLFLANSGARSGFVQILDEVRFPAQIQTARLCSDARTRSSDHKRTRAQHAIESAASSEARSLSRIA